MTKGQVAKMLAGTGLPFAYRSWPVDGAPVPPYGVYLFVRSNNFSADGHVYYTAGRFHIELYSSKPDAAAEEAIEHVLNANNLFWEKSETYVTSEKLFQVLYEIEV